MLSLVRREDWETRLLDVVARHQAMPFRWGAYDCATLFGEAVEAMTGADPLARFRPWPGPVVAARALASTRHGSVRDYLADLLPGIPPALAGRGDVGYGPDIGPLSCPAVIVGAFAVSRDERGWISASRDLLTTTFRVG